MGVATERVFIDVRAERVRQDAKFGPIQGMELTEWVCVLTEEIGEAAEEHGMMVLAALMAALMTKGGHVAQAVHETVGERTTAVRHGRAAIRKELIQTAAVAVNIVEHMDRGDV